MISRLLMTVILVTGLCFTSFAQLTSVNNFGSNPGNLNMYYYAPANVPAGAPIVVAMHGCTQSASSFATETGWNALADEYGFYVVYPEQKSGNNSSSCFNWFENGDINRGSGEALSIRNMVAYMTNNKSAANTAYVMGFSAGGAMTTVMLATYPEVFRSGAVMAGVPYRAGVGLTAAFSAMNPGVDNTPQQWGNLVRNASSFSGDWPTVAIFHGTSDFTVRDMNSKEVTDQFLNLHDPSITSNNQVVADVTTPSFNGAADVTRQGYKVNGQEVVVRYTITGMGHAVAVDPDGTGSEGKGGSTGAYATDEDFYSCYFAAKFWGLTGVTPPPPPSLQAPTDVTATALSTSQIKIDWTDTNTIETGYRIDRSATLNGTYTAVATVASDIETYTDTGLSANTTYYYKVVALDGANEETSAVVSATTDDITTTPTLLAPANLAASVISETQVDLSWTDQNTTETAHLVERKASGESSFTVLATLGADVESYTDNTTTANTTYTYRVAVQEGTTTVYSSEVTVTTPAPPAQSYTIEQLSGPYFFAQLSTSDCSQSFTTVDAGNLTSIEVKLKSPINGSKLKIFAGDNITSTPIYTQNGISLGSGIQTIQLSSAVALSANSSYTFMLENASLGLSYTNVYNGGSFYMDGVNYAFYDAYFIITIEGSGSARFAKKVETPNIQWYTNGLNILHVNTPTSARLSLIGLDGKLIQENKLSTGTQQIAISKKGIVIGLLQVGEQTYRKKFFIQ
ncbi:extracellular catalytic domain type 1 short-chain-length polyhydroxyalkanoate depolymerase [Algivirga pacifica]